MDSIRLPENVSAAFPGLAGAVLTAFQSGVVALGGGTLLAALWGHRVSTDLDLFIAPENLQKAHLAVAPKPLGAILNGALVSAGVDIHAGTAFIHQRAAFMMGKCADGTPWSLADMAYANPATPMHKAIEDTGIRASTLTEVMIGKIAGRAFNANLRDTADHDQKPSIPIRDCYDICVCAVQRPDVLFRVLDILPIDARARIARNYHAVPHDLHLRDPKPIIAPTWAVELEGVGPAIGDAVLSGNLSLLPPAAPAPSVGSAPRTRSGPDR